MATYKRRINMPEIWELLPYLIQLNQLRSRLTSLPLNNSRFRQCFTQFLRHLIEGIGMTSTSFSEGRLGMSFSSTSPSRLSSNRSGNLSFKSLKSGIFPEVLMESFLRPECGYKILRSTSSSTSMYKAAKRGNCSILTNLYS